MLRPNRRKIRCNLCMSTCNDEMSQFRTRIAETDTDRAIKHAELLRKFTQMPAYAAIAGIHRHDEIMDIIHKGDVFWFELDYGRFAP